MKCLIYILILIILFFPKESLAGKTYNNFTRSNDFCITVKDESEDVVNTKCLDIQVADGVLEYDNNGTRDTKDDFYILHAGLSVYGVTNMATSQNAIFPSYNYVRKSISSDPAFQTGELPDGQQGQMITIEITSCPTGASWTLTPNTATGFTSLYFEGVGDIITLIYLNDSIGWIRLNQESVNIIP